MLALGTSVLGLGGAAALARGVSCESRPCGWEALLRIPLPAKGVASTATELRTVAVRPVGVASEAERRAGARVLGVFIAVEEAVSEARGRGIVAPVVVARGVGSTLVDAAADVLPVREVLGFGIDRAVVAVSVFIDGEVPVPAVADTALERPGVVGPSEGIGGIG